MIGGRYTLDREIGRGGMGAVWLGRDITLDRQVALKRIGIAPGAQTPDVRRAGREARLAAMLSHPHVVSVFDMIEEDGQQWLVMEYVEGHSLAQLVRETGPLDPATTASVLAQVADALAAAHAAGIVHRDVKPSNILLTQAGTAKLSDFGIARSQTDDNTLTQTGLVSGSPAYLAPEVASGHPATAASDVWAMGATLYHARAGRPPYPGENVMAVLYRIVHEDPPRLPEEGWLGELLEHTMTPVPGQRWSMSQVGEYLRQGPQPTLHQRHSVAAAVGGRGREFESPVHPSPDPGEPTRAGIRPVRHPGRGVNRLLLLAATLALVVLVVAAFAIGRMKQPDASPPPTTPSASETPSPSADPSESAPSAAGMEKFVHSYLDTITRDTTESWNMLTPGFQVSSGGFRAYDAFWQQYRSATLTSLSADPAQGTVTYRVDYLHKDGSESSDDVTLSLVLEAGHYLIDGES